MQVVIQKIPENLPEFELLAAEGRQPERICALFLCALALFDRNKEAGAAAMNLLRGPRPAGKRVSAAGAVRAERARRPQTTGFGARLSACVP